MFDKWKTKRALCKIYKIYSQKARSLLYSSSYSSKEYEQLQDIQYAIAYVLCEYFNFNYKFYYDDFPFSDKWGIAYDYIQYYDECKKAYEKITEDNNTNTMRYNYIKHYINGSKSNYVDGNIMYNAEDNCLYFYDGNNFINIG